MTNQKEELYIIHICTYNEGSPEINNRQERFLIAKSRKQAEDLLYEEYDKTYEELRKESSFDPVNKQADFAFFTPIAGNYEINADGYLYETGKIHIPENV